MFKFRGVTLALTLFCLLAVPASGFAQVSASLTGLVTDPSGALVAAATVTATNLETGSTRSVMTDASGRYQRPNSPSVPTT